MKNLKILFLILLVQATVACDDWLDVSPKTDIDLENQVETSTGLFEMLNGVYIKMGVEELYGESLSYGMVEFLAQNHYNNSNSPFVTFSYTDPIAKEQVENTWLGIYNAIANNNLLLESMEENKGLLSTDDYNVMKGEALAIRAFLHFDALRLFGERYSEETKDNVQIPYVKTFELVRYQHSTAEVVYNEILSDLEEAEALLMESDPIVASSYDGSFFELNQRRHHFHYYAVLATKARVYMYKGDKTNALQYAEKVINEFTWSWVSEDKLNYSGDQIHQKDVLFSDEVIAGLNVFQLPTYYTNKFESRTAYTAASSSTNFAKSIFEVELPGAMPWFPPVTGPGITDWRYLYLMGKDDTGNLAIAQKYNQDPGSIEGLLEVSTVPLFRITEMMLIVAEIQLETDIDASKAILADLFSHRGINIDLSAAAEYEVMERILKEFRKELYVEGQCFFNYKRLGLTSIPQMNSFSPNRTMEAEDYIVPLPDNELEFGNR
nr:RagB/SusD family nutrient uptake outer membrane protein [uncultured Marinifilum sp.]